MVHAVAESPAIANMDFWGKQWLVAAYCWLRDDYRSFRVDRIREIRSVPADAGRLEGLSTPISLDGYVRAMETREACDRASNRS